MPKFLASVKCWIAPLFQQEILTCGKFTLIWVTLASVSCISINRGDPALLKELQAECTREGISVKLWFKTPFTGVAYSHGHYETNKCRYISISEDHVQAKDQSGTNFSFLIPMNECGTVYYEGASSSSVKQQQEDMRTNKSNENEVYIENTLLIQNDPTIQEAGDLAKTLRCVWQKEIRQPLMASLPIGNNRMSTSKLHGAASNRVKTITATMHKSRPTQAIGSLPLNSSQNSAHFNLRFQKRGHVQSVPFNERRQHSRALELDEESEEITSPEKYTQMLLKNEKSDLVSALPLKHKPVSSTSVTQTPHIINWGIFMMLQFVVLFELSTIRI